ncbi:nitrate- and nitrite sensing domain-containing protein [Phytohabitans houttuyneae]|uniref:nitrate- and nitrite sensing domain-containing protein n=1 Tax=Phytohabitans houttuyneae TaxID=1076126 RepID=UPI001FE4F28E|nr:nitrate- and nitrite sensing domain-containing protein [Phytohabitans houttuyneae]
MSLFALWAFAAYVTLREGFNLLTVSRLDSEVSQPSEKLLLELQKERRLTLVYLGRPGPGERAALATQRVSTDAARATFERKAGAGSIDASASDTLERRIDATFALLRDLPADREAVDARSTDRGGAGARYSGVIDSIFHIYDSLATLDDKELAKDVRTLIQLNRAREVIAQEDALVAGVLAAGRMTVEERERLVQLAGAQRFYSELAADELPAEDRARYDRMVDGPAYSMFRGLEERLMDSDPEGSAPKVTAADWDAALPPVLDEYYNDVIRAGGSAVVKRSTPMAIGVVVRLLAAGGLGLLAVIASIIVSITTARALVRQLERLRTAAWDLANVRLPGVVERLRQGEKVDVAAESPPLTFGNDEIGQVGQAINAVQETAIRAAVDQAELRHGVRDLFLGLARRNQALVHRQLKVLDEIERRETDAHELADLFKVDHLATRMRRNAENLIVLSGAVPGRRWRNPVPFVDVVRGAVAEVEDYTRVSVLPIDVASLSGRAVSDVIHLLAELIENAASFSPPYTMVNVGGQKVANGFVVEIEDRGLGMSEQELDAANDLVSNPPEFNLSSTARLGLYVVGRLAVRHGIDVRLRRSPYGGTMAIVLIPSGLVVADPTQETPPEGAEAETGVAEADRRVRAYQLLRATPTVPAATPAATETPAPATPLPSAAKVPAEPKPEAPVSPAPIVARARVAPLDRRDDELPTAGRPPVADGPVTNGSGHPEPPRDAVTLTPSGLPWRVRQASIAAPLRENQPPAPPEPQPPAPAPRTPEQTRSMMSSYQSATRRGRAEAERLNAETPRQAPEPDRPAPPGDTEPSA